FPVAINKYNGPATGLIIYTMMIAEPVTPVLIQPRTILYKRTVWFQEKIKVKPVGCTDPFSSVQVLAK
ncbi:hypothetical protein RSW84_30935, partial [Escherichia coli]